MVIWIIGLSGTGKTTLANSLVNKIRSSGKPVALVDGDQVRLLFKNDLGHDIKSRKINAERICQLCLFLESQEINVVCAILSVFKESREWCRSNFKNYYEVFIDTPLEILKQRDSKSIYSRFNKGLINNVAGLDLDFPIPKFSNLIIKNNDSLENLLSYKDLIFNECFAE